MPRASRPCRSDATDSDRTQTGLTARTRWRSAGVTSSPAYGAIFFSAVSAARRAAHTRHEVDGITAGGVHGTSGRRNPCTVPWTSVPWTYSHSVNTSGSRVLRLRRSTRSKASRRSIMLLQVLRRLDRLRFPCRIIHSIGVVVPHRNLPERRPRTETSVQGPIRFVRQSNSLSHVHRRTFAAAAH
jgi:hypothetical protein